MTSMRRLAPLVVLVTSLVLAAPAFAADNGEGLVGETDDRSSPSSPSASWSFFALFVLARHGRSRRRLERRKEERKAVELRKRVGW